MNNTKNHIVARYIILVFKATNQEHVPAINCINFFLTFTMQDKCNITIFHYILYCSFQLNRNDIKNRFIIFDNKHNKDVHDRLYKYVWSIFKNRNIVKCEYEYYNTHNP